MTAKLGTNNWTRHVFLTAGKEFKDVSNEKALCRKEGRNEKELKEKMGESIDSERNK